MKRESTPLTKKLKQYSALSGSLLAITGIAHAQVIYTDVDPDETLSHFSGYLDTYELDVNNDGVTDFMFLSYFDSNNYGINWGVLGVSPIPHSAGNINAIAGNTGATSNGNTLIFPSAISMNDSINESMDFHPFYENSIFPISPPMWFQPNSGNEVLGNWNGVSDHYLALKFSPDGVNTYYGWVRCDVDVWGEIIIKDYAYNSAPNTPLNAGQGEALSMAPVTQSNKIRIFAFEKEVYINTSVVARNEITITVTDLLGKTMLTSATKENNFHLSLSNIASGMYLVTVKDGAETKSCKVSIR